MVSGHARGQVTSWNENQRINLKAPDTAAEIINIIINDQIYKILIILKYEKQIFQVQKTLILFI